VNLLAYAASRYSKLKCALSAASVRQYMRSFSNVLGWLRSDM
jgi:hypothetical protein